MRAPRDQLALAVDVPLEEGAALWRRVSPHVAWAKVGLSLFVEHGPLAVRRFLELGARVFLDLKLHDIPNTVELAAARAGELGVGLLTVHASGGAAMLRAAVSGAARGASATGRAPPKILAVTALTSLAEADLRDVGFSGAPADVVLRLAELAAKAGVGGLVCSPAEVGALRSRFGPALFLCTPGIRPAGTAAADQARAATPALARRAGADLLVVGRPIYAASDPVQSAAAIAQELSDS